MKLLFIVFGMFTTGFICGYQYPRDVEIESTKPIAITYEVTREAAHYLVLKAVKGIEPK